MIVAPSPVLCVLIYTIAFANVNEQANAPAPYGDYLTVCVSPLRSRAIREIGCVRRSGVCFEVLTVRSVGTGYDTPDSGEFGQIFSVPL